MTPTRSMAPGLLLALLVVACAKAPADATAATATGAAPTPTATAPAADGAGAPADPNLAGNLQASIGEGVGKAVSLSTNAQAHEYAELMAAVTAEMLDSNPDACARVLLPGQFGPVGWDQFPASHRARFMALQQAMFATARNAPNPAPAEAEAGPLYDAMAEKIFAAHGEQALDGVQGEAGAAAACRAWNRIYAGVAAESVDDGGRVMRWLSAP